MSSRARDLTEPLSNIINEGRLEEIPGIGSVIADIVTALHRTGTHPLLERLRQDVKWRFDS